MQSANSVAAKVAGLAFSFGAFLTLAAGSAHATPLTINDNYIGAQPTNSNYNGLDIVGATDKFDVQSLTVDITGSTLQLGISTSYFDNAGQYGTTFGDVLISSNGWHPFGAAPYLEDSASNGESWEYALVFSDHGEQFAQSGQPGNMIGTSGTVSLVAISPETQIQLSHATGDYRANQEVGIGNAGSLTTLSLGTWTIAQGQNGYSSLNLNISLANVSALLTAQELGFHFGFSCGNDVIEGSYPNTGSSEVPEPSALLLLLSGVTGAIRIKPRRARK